MEQIVEVDAAHGADACIQMPICPQPVVISLGSLIILRLYQNIYPPVRAAVVVGYVHAGGEPVSALEALGVHQPERYRTPQVFRQIINCFLDMGLHYVDLGENKHI